MTRVAISSDNLLFARLAAEHLSKDGAIASVEIAPEAAAGTALPDVDVLVVDAAMEGARELVARAAAAEPRLRALVFGLRRDDAEVTAFAEAGASGLVPRQADADELARAIRAAASDECRCPPWIASALLRRLAQGVGTRPPLGGVERLTEREAEIARLLDAGCSNKEIARQLRIELATVKNHVHNILQKLQVPSRAKAVAELRALGLL